MLHLVESFLSFQGEGKYAGSPSIFLRFGGCNFKCEGFKVAYNDGNCEEKFGCDSFFAVDKSFKNEWIGIHSTNELIDIVDKLTEDINYKPNVVITGGEPLLNFTDALFYEFIQTLLKKGFNVHIETNASIKIDFERYPLYKNLIFAMSVKLLNSRESKTKRINKDAIKSICENAKDAFFKFVVDETIINDNNGQKEIKEIISFGENQEVFLMPMGKDGNELSLNDKKVASYCIKEGYNYADRIHIRLYNDKKGV